MKTFIIHNYDQSDRDDNVIKLSSNYDEVSIIRGIVPTWIENPFNRAVMGCSLTHLSILHKYINEESILVLEDDACLLPENVKEIENSKIPDDAGILLLGGDNVPNYNNINVNNTVYHEIYPPFFGTHTVWYNTAKLKNTDFLINAYKTLASNSVGETGICYESVLLHGLLNTNLKIYRPANMLYTTIETFSSRNQKIESPNKSTISVK